MKAPLTLVQGTRVGRTPSGAIPSFCCEFRHVSKENAPSHSRRGVEMFTSTTVGRRTAGEAYAFAALGCAGASPTGWAVTSVTCSALSAISSYQRSWCCFAQLTST